MRRLLTVLAAVLAASAAAAQNTPAGLWKTIDDHAKKERSLVRVVDSNGVLSARIEKLLDPQAKLDRVCDQCSDDRKDKPVVGLEIVRGVKKNADSDAEPVWDGGTILDPENGKSYKVRMTPLEGGKKLQVRGYVGSPVFGRSQVWVRVE